MTPRLDKPKAHNSAIVSDCGIVIIEANADTKEFIQTLGRLELDNSIPLLTLASVPSTPCSDDLLRSFLSGQIWRQLVVVGNLIEPVVVGVCLFALGEGFQVFCIDTELSNLTPIRQINLIRLAQSGVSPLSVAQFEAEILCSMIDKSLK